MRYIIRIIGLPLALLVVLLVAGCSHKASQTSDSASEKTADQDTTEVVLDRFLTPQVQDIPFDIDSCLDAVPYDQYAIQGIAINVWKLNDGRCYPSMQFTVLSSPDQCEEGHYHFDIMSIGGHIRPDSHPCGSAVDSDVVDSSKNIWVSPGQYEQISARFKEWREQ